MRVVWIVAGLGLVVATGGRAEQPTRLIRVREGDKTYRVVPDEDGESFTLREMGANDLPQDPGQPAGSGAGWAAPGAGAKPRGPAGPLPAPENESFETRLAAARRRLEGAGKAATAAALRSKDDGAVFAALERAFREKWTVPERPLRKALRSVNHPRSARAVAFHLSRHETPTATAALAAYVARGMPGAAEVRKFLGPGAEAAVAAAAAREARVRRWMTDAATGTPGSKLQRDAIASLAGEPGVEVRGLLEQLARDRDEAVAAPAKAALDRREAAGL